MLNLGLNLNIHNPLMDKLESSEKECQLLNEMITNKTSFMDYFQEVRIDLFAIPLNIEMHKIIQNVQDRDKDVNVSSIRSEIKMTNKNMGKSSLEDQLDIILSYSINDTIPNLVKDLDTMRIVFNEIIGNAKSKFMNNEPIDDIIKSITESIISMDSTGIDRTSYGEHVDQTIDRINNPEKFKDYLKLRWEEWNRNFGGVIKDRYYAIGGESGAGKTAFVCDMIEQLAEDYPDEVAILFYSYEMSQGRVITRLISKKAKFTESKLSQRTKPLTKEELSEATKAAEEIKRYPLEIVYSTLSDRELKLKTRQFALKNKGKHLIIFLDHIGLVDGNENDMRIKTIRTSKVLKSFATDYKASVFVLTQLKKELTDENNPANKKSFHKPNDSHIMESGAIKADSDAVVLLWRPEMRFQQISYGGHEMFDARNKLWMLNVKNRDGQCPTDIIMGCDIKYSDIYNLADPFSPEMTQSTKDELMKMQQINESLRNFNTSSGISFAPITIPAEESTDEIPF
jgi:replicative DNA helicase